MTEFDPATMLEADLVACIAEAQTHFGSLAFDKTANIVSDKGSYRYDYLTEGALMSRVRALLSPMGVAVLVSTLEAKHGNGSCIVTVEIRFLKGSEQLAVRGEGYGQDNRDKAYNKALTSAVRTCLTKTFLQGGDIDPEQTVNELPTRPAGPPKLSEASIKRLTKKAIDCGVVTQDGALDQRMLLRLASYVRNEQIMRIDEIPSSTLNRLVEGSENHPTPVLEGYAVNAQNAIEHVIEREVENGWEWKP